MSYIVDRLEIKGERGKDSFERRGLCCGLLGNRKLVEVHKNSQLLMARNLPRSVKDKEDMAYSLATRRLSWEDSAKDMRKYPIGESDAIDWTVDRTSLRAPK